MLLIKKPKDDSGYFKVQDNQLNTILQFAGFMPLYKWNKTYYYIMTKDLQNFIKTGVI